ncbi:uncharacterized protein LOC135635077 [Musa acuminata AAA Group]|uniref:Transmembrane protein n=1 Tax=Musa acuminata subsp. malaccensis TaxID=214687 RepID=A0A804IM36_MUSAM|nr:PREDICTED: uncharacterized protein LOC103980853 [Musa acuminata subsp. malaccensis]
MLLLSQAPNGALSARRCPSSSSSAVSSSLSPFSKTDPSLFSKSRPRFPSRNPRRPRPLSLSAPAVDPGRSARPLSSPPAAVQEDEIVSVGDDGVPLEGVIQFEKPGGSSKLLTWAQVGLLAGGDVLCLLIFSAVGRFSHGLPVFDFETLRTADPFIAGWVLSAYFLGGYGDDGRGVNGSMKAVLAAVKSWAIGIPLGLVIRSATSGHVPPTPFMLITMGSTGILLIAWRALVCNLLPSNRNKQNDVYKRGSAFELFELLTSLVRRW